MEGTTNRKLHLINWVIYAIALGAVTTFSIQLFIHIVGLHSNVALSIVVWALFSAGALLLAVLCARGVIKRYGHQTRRTTFEQLRSSQHRNAA